MKKIIVILSIGLSVGLFFLFQGKNTLSNFSLVACILISIFFSAKEFARKKKSIPPIGQTKILARFSIEHDEVKPCEGLERIMPIFGEIDKEFLDCFKNGRKSLDSKVYLRRFIPKLSRKAEYSAKNYFSSFDKELKELACDANQIITHYCDFSMLSNYHSLYLWNTTPQKRNPVVKLVSIKRTSDLSVHRYQISVRKFLEDFTPGEINGNKLIINVRIKAY